jgi:hypothetical protein
MSKLSFARMIAMPALLAVSAFAADVTGKWTGKMETPNGTRDSVITLKQDGEALTGSMAGRNGDTPITEGSVKGDDVAFTVVRNFGGEERKMVYKGKVAGAEMKLKFTMMDMEREITYKKAE